MKGTDPKSSNIQEGEEKEEVGSYREGVGEGEGEEEEAMELIKERRWKALAKWKRRVVQFQTKVGNDVVGTLDLLFFLVLSFISLFLNTELILKHCVTGLRGDGVVDSTGCPVDYG